MSSHNITPNEQALAKIQNGGQPAQKIFPLFPGVIALPEGSHSKPRRATLAETLKQANENVDVGAALDILYDAIFLVTRAGLREIYDLPSGASLKKAVYERSPFGYPYLIAAELTVIAGIENLIEAADYEEVSLGLINKHVADVALAFRSQMVSVMKYTKISFITGEKIREDEDEDLPF